MPEYAVNGDQVLTTRDSMIRAKSRFEEAILELQRLRNEVGTTVSALIGPGWGGSTANKFGSVMVQWDEQYQIVQQRLQLMTETLQMNIDQYMIGDEDAQHETNTLGSAIAT